MAARFFVAGDGNWSDTNHWSTTSGGGGGSVVPTNIDDVTFDINSGNCTLDTAVNKVCKSLTTTTDYTGKTLTFNVQCSVSGSITIAAGTLFAGAASNKLRMIAAGTWTTGVTIPQNVEIGGTTTFTCTLANALTCSGDLLLSNTTSTIFSGAFAIQAATCTIQGTQTVTMSGNVTITGLTTIGDANLFAGSFNWNTAGLTTTGNLGVSANTPVVVLTGGTWTGAAGILSTNCTFAGNVTVSGTVLYSTGTLTYSSGTITTTSSTLSLGASTTLDTNGVTWNNITLSAAVTITINSLLSATGTLTMPNAAVTFAGTAGFTVGTFSNTTITANRTWTFHVGNTYTITTAFNTVSAAAQTVRFLPVSSSPGSKYFLTLQPGAAQDIGFMDPTDADSSLGQTIFTYHGTITTCFNWTATYVNGGGCPSPFPRSQLLGI